MALRRNQRRIMATLLLALFLVAMLIWPVIKSDRAGVQITVDEPAAGVPTAPVMTKVRFHGTNRENPPFNLTADEARQVSESVVALAGVQGDAILESRKWINLTAVQGNYHVEEKLLDLFGGVTLYRDDGIEVTTQAAKANLMENKITGNESVLLTAPQGTLEGDRFAIMDNGKKIVMKGHIKLVTY